MINNFDVQPEFLLNFAKGLIEVRLNANVNLTFKPDVAREFARHLVEAADRLQRGQETSR